MIIEHENTFKQVLSDGVNLFLGAGFSVLAKDEKGSNIPLGIKLKEELLEVFNKGELSSLNLPQICAILEAERKDDFYALLKKRFSIGEYSDKYYSLDKIVIKTIFTTNIDNLIYKLFATSNNSYINDVVIRGPSYGDRAAIDLITLHGSITHEGETLTFSTLDLAASFSSDPDKWHLLTQRIQSTPTLFWGYSLEDAGVLQALSPASTHGRAHSTKWIVIREENEATIQYFRALGFDIIIATTEELLDYINEHINIDPSTPHPIYDSKKDFAKWSLPPIGAVPVRSILEFFLGTPPAWSDIYSGQLYRTSHFATLIDAINAHKNLIILGIPACGKTTLLMQVASSIEFRGHKLICETPSPEEISLLLNKLAGEPALIFVDDFCGDVDAYNMLLHAPNVLTIGADRDINFESVSHRLHRDNCKIVDVTEVRETDIQQIFSRIPSEIKIDRLIKPKVERGVSVSIFEFIETNTIGPTLRQRFASVLSRLQKESKLLHDLLVMISYVHACGVPVSYDTVYAFLRGEISSWEEIYKLMEQLGSMVSEYKGQLIEEEQDYYVARSTLLSEAVLSQVSSSDFRRIFLRFHEQVSSWRICRFDVFKRKAYDERFARKAFSAWEEGLEFYSSLVTKDSSPFLLQQGALYLLHKHKNREAFNWIDRAVVASGNRVPSIRNTHAIILFRTNFGIQDTDGTVQRTLRQSMDILAECYSYDKRKTYHATAFADQALQYYQSYSDPTGKGYLETAAKWLAEELKESPWNREVKRLSRMVTNKIKNL